MRYIPYGRHQLDRDDLKAVAQALRGDWITQGPKIAEFEKELARYCGARYAVCVSSGTAALHLACLCAGIGSGDEVIASPMTFVASANCILYCGARPVFADIQEDTANIAPAEINRKITKHTKAIIPVHYAGHPCDLKEIQQIARSYNLTVIEDAAHALGAEYRGSKIGSCRYSDLTTLSFHPVKHITTGEGGAVLTNKKGIHEKLLMLRNHGITKEARRCRRYDGPWYYEQQLLGFNYRITDFQCALGISQLGKIDAFVQKRREIAEIYRRDLSKIGRLILPAEREYVKSAWHLYTLRFPKTKRKKIFINLRKHNIGAQVHYLPVYLHPYYKKLGFKKGLCPKAEEFYTREISIPIFNSLKRSQLKYVIGKITNLVKMAG